MAHSKRFALILAVLCMALCLAPSMAFAAQGAHAASAPATLKAAELTASDESVDLTGAFVFSASSKMRNAIEVSGSKVGITDGDASNENVRLYVHAEADGAVSIQSVSTGKFLQVSGSKIVCKAYVEGDENNLWTAAQKGDGYSFTHVATGKKLTFSDDALLAGSTSTRWTLSEVDLVSEGNYLIVNEAKKTVMAVKASSFETGSRILVEKKTGYLGQVFSVSRLADANTYAIKSALTNKCVGVESKAEDAAVQINTTKPKKKDRWIAVMDKTAGLAFQNAASKKLLTADGNGGNGKYVRSQASKGSETQSWSFEASDQKYNKALERAAKTIKNRKSKTSHYVVVDKSRHWLMVFKGSKGQWVPLRGWLVSIGTSGWPTPSGDFKIGWKGYSFGEEHGYSVYYYTNYAVIGGLDYHFHSIKYYPNTMKVKDGRLGKNISGGCVRMSLNNAKWLQKTVKRNTAVKIYS